MMILADSIDFPLFLIYGLGFFVAITLAITVIETIVVRLIAGYRIVPWSLAVFGANLVSTVLGSLVWAFSGVIVSAMGIHTVPDYFHRYYLAAIVIVAIYFVESVLVEGVLLAGRRMRQKTSRSGRRLWVAVALANVASYALVGPLFWLATRPSFNGVQVVDDPAQVANCSDPVYFIGPGRGDLCRIHADGHDRQVVIPGPIKDYVLSADQRCVLYVAGDGDLYARRLGDESMHIASPEGDPDFLGLSISPDGLRVSYAQFIGWLKEGHLEKGPRSELWRYDRKFQWRVAVFNLERRQAEASRLVTLCCGADVDLAWDANDPAKLWAAYEYDDVLSAKIVHGYAVRDGELSGVTARTDPPTDTCFRSRGTWFDKDTQGDLTAGNTHDLRLTLDVYRGDEHVFQFYNDTGLMMWLLAGQNPPRRIAFLSSRGVVIFELGGAIYVADALHNRLALVTGGRDYILPTRRFQRLLGQDFLPRGSWNQSPTSAPTNSRFLMLSPLAFPVNPLNP